MSWIEPKTDWTEDSYFNIEDYNRIIGNLKYLKEFSEKFIKNYNIDNMEEKKAYSDYIYSREINAIENSLELLNLNTYKFNIGEKMLFRDNGPTPLWNEFNRIESAVILLYKTMVSHKNALKRLDFALGGEKGIKV